ncbi:MAG: CHAT domain-containing protein, partial [bacterium]|nr:CHAT domain-containing protein [bacterium]
VNKNIIPNKFIKDFAKAGAKARKKEWLTVCMVIAAEKKDQKTLADVLYHTGDYFLKISGNKKATDYYDKALLIYLKLNDPVGLGNVYQDKGQIYWITGDNSQAFEMYKKALAFYEKAGYLEGQGNVYLGKGEIYSIIGDNSRALEMYGKALPFFEKAGDSSGQGGVYLLKGNIYLSGGNKSRALAMYDKALWLYGKAGHPVGQGNVYFQKGLIYYYTGDNSKSLEMYHKALLIYRKARQQVGQGNVYSRMGVIYSRIGNNSKALEMHDKALPFYEKAGFRVGQGNVYSHKARIYVRIGDRSGALGMFDKALPFYRKVGQRVGLGNVYLSKGEIYLSRGENSRALGMFDKALSFYKKAAHPIGQGNVYLLKGSSYFSTGRNSKALEMHDRALSFFQKLGDPVGQGNVYQGKGDIYFNTRDNSKALEMFNKALHFYKRHGGIQLESGALYRKAKVLAKLGRRDEALVLFEKGIANLETVRTQTAFSGMKQTFMDTVYHQYEETVLFMLENKHGEKGFKYAESMRTRVFLDRMAEGLVRLDKGLTPGLEEKRDYLVKKLSRLSTEIHKTGGKKEKKKLAELEEQYRDTEKEFTELLIKIRINNPLYASVRYPRPVSVQTLQTTVLKENELLLRYFISPGKLYVFVLSKESFKVIPVAANQKELKAIVKRYALALDENNPRDIKRYGKMLYKKLVKPLDKVMEKGGDIIIIPDEDLVKVPFETLIVDNDNNKTGSPVFLLEKYRINYIQSASLLWFLRKHYNDNHSKSTKIASNGFIGFGDPVYDYRNFKQAQPGQGSLRRSARKGVEIRELHRSRYSRAGGIMDRLPRSGEEVRSIARLFQKESQKGEAYSREQATETTAKAPQMRDYDYIHFACHGLLNDTFQSLVLSQLPSGQSSEDGYFTLNEIMNCHWNARLVVLSACQTGSGKLHRGEGVTGLTRAVMYAGTPAVVASLWKVDDTAAKELMVRFYRNMIRKKLDTPEALRQAKLELLKNKQYSSPFFWGAFVMYGW